jgi:hypothetical protein
MSYQFYEVPTFANGDWITPSLLNTYFKGNFAAVWRYNAAGQIVYSLSGSELGVLNLTAGSLLVGKGAAAPGLIPKGLARQTLQMKADASEPEYGYPSLPECTVKRSSTFPIAATSEILVDWNDEDSDPYGWHSNSVNPHQIIPNIPGRYEATLYVEIAGVSGSGTGWWTARVYTPAGIMGGRFLVNHDAFTRMFPIVTPTFACNGTTDAVALTLQHQEGGSRSMTTMSRFTMKRVGP